MLRNMEISPRGRAAWGLVLALALAGRLGAQISTASVEVQATGTDGAPLPGVTVTLQNMETGLTRTDVTGEQGTATLPALPPGTYKAEFELQGFSPVSQEGIALRVGQTVQVRATLSPAVTETITDAARPRDPARFAVGVLREGPGVRSSGPGGRAEENA